MPIFDSAAETMIHNWNKTIEGTIPITLVTTGHTEDDQFYNFSDHITRILSKLDITHEKGKDNPTNLHLPGFHLTETITYSALPLKKELEPFLGALSQIDTPTDLSDSIQQALDQIEVPVRLKLYIALDCPHCPNVVKTVIPLALHCENIHLHIIDGTLFPETAQADSVLSAPCLILDNDFRWTGNVQAFEVIKMITNRDPSILSSDTLKVILEDGDAAWITRQMLEKRKIFDAFIELMLHDTWSVRLGAMVVVEELAEADPELAVSMCGPLMNQFDGRDITVQGDILYALGEAGDKKTKVWIAAKRPELLHEDLIDAAEEALDTLSSKDK